MKRQIFAALLASLAFSPAIYAMKGNEIPFDLGYCSRVDIYDAWDTREKDATLKLYGDTQDVLMAALKKENNLIPAIEFTNDITKDKGQIYFLVDENGELAGITYELNNYSHPYYRAKQRIFSMHDLIRGALIDSYGDTPTAKLKISLDRKQLTLTYLTELNEKKYADLLINIEGDAGKYQLVDSEKKQS
jgi:hypothetical protein